jgi:hypothetical protein
MLNAMRLSHLRYTSNRANTGLLLDLTHQVACLLGASRVIRNLSSWRILFNLSLLTLMHLGDIVRVLETHEKVLKRGLLVHYRGLT